MPDVPDVPVCPTPVLTDLWTHFTHDLRATVATPTGAIGTGIVSWITATNAAFISQSPEGRVLTTVEKIAAARDAEGAILNAGLNDPSLPVAVNAATGLIAGAVMSELLAGVVIGGVALPWIAGAAAVVVVATLVGTAAQAYTETLQDAYDGKTTDIAPGSVWDPNENAWVAPPLFGTPDGTPSPVGGAPGCPGVDRSQRKPPPGIPHQPPTFSDPLVLDLAGTGLNLTNIASSSAYFDYSNSGYRQHTGWLGSGMGMLVTAPADGATITADNVIGSESGNGFGDLAAMDSNGDGIINAADPLFASLRVWVDNKDDGSSTAGELFSLSDLGTVSISLNSQSSVEVLNGNSVTATAQFTKSDGTTHEIAEVNFANSRQDTIIPSSVNTNYSLDALKLPDLDGYGALPDLRIAMSTNLNLTNAVMQLVENAGTMSGADFDTAFQNMLKLWAGIPDTPPSGTVYADPRHVAFIYAFYGIDPSTDPYYQQSPNFHNGPAVWEPAYRSLVDELKTRFVSQIASTLANYGAGAGYLLNNPYTAFAGLGFDQSTDSFKGDFQAVFNMVASQGLMATDPATYWGQVLPILEGLRVELDPNKGESINSLASYATLADMPWNVLVNFVADLGLTVKDEGATTGNIAENDKNFVLIGTGDKTIAASGTVGSSTYVYDASGGDVSLTYITGDTVILRDLGRNDVQVGIDDGTVVITVKSTGKQLQLAEFLNYSPQGVIALADGTRILSDQVFDFVAGEAAQALGTGSQDDSLADTALSALGLTVVRSVTGSTMTGSSNYNVFEPPLDQAAVTIDCNGLGQGNILRLGSGVGPSDIQVRQSNDGQDLIVTITATGEQITLQGQGGAPSGHIAYVSFADGTMWNANALWAASNVEATAQNASTIYGAYGADQLIAGAGTVALVARDPGATLTTGTGADKLETVGKGNTLVIHGDTTTVEISSNGADFVDTGLNVLKLAAGVTAQDVTVSQSNNKQDIILTLASGQVITLDHGLSGMFVSYGGGANQSIIPVDQIQFSDGTAWSWQDIIDRSIATMEARGNDTVFDGDAYGSNVLYAGAGTVTLDASLHTSISPLTLMAGAGQDTLIGGLGDATYVVGADATNVTIEKSISAQRPVANAGNNNVLSFGQEINESDISVAADSAGRDIILTNAATGATIRLVDQISGSPFDTVESVTFADGVTWSAQQLIAKANASTTGGTIFGTSGNDTLIAPNVAATLSGKGGNDTLISGPANTLMAGGAGSDLYVVNAGNGPVTIDDAHDQVGSYNDINTLQFGQGILPADLRITQSTDGRDILIVDTATGQTVTLHNQLTTGTQGTQINSVAFADGTVWSQETLLEKSIAGMVANGATAIYGDNFNDTIVAGDGDKTIYTGRGNVHVIAGAGNQVIAQSSGAGNIEIGNGSYNYLISGSHQTIVHLHGVDPGSLVVSQANNGQDLVLRSPLSGETITLAAQFEDRYQIVSQVVFDDGTVWTSADLTARSIANAEALQAPVIYGDYFDNVLTGGTTDQTLVGGGGNDTLIAGTGNDTLIGGLAGNERDTYVINANAGNAVIVGNTDTFFSGYQDTLQYGPGINPADISVMQSEDGQSIILTNSVTGKAVTIENILESPRLQVKFDDGTIWSPSVLWSASAAGSEAAHAPVIYGDATDNVLMAGAYSVTLIGNGGDDTFVSGTGDATFVGSGNGNLYQIGADAGTVTIENAPDGPQSATVSYAAGIDPANIQVHQSADGHDLLLVNTQTGQTVILKDQIASGEPSAGGGGGGPIGIMAFESSNSPFSQTTLVTFADGTSWAAADLLAKSINQADADGASTIYGDRNSNTLAAGSGNVTLIGQGGDDTFVNGSGNDTFVGSQGSEHYLINAKSGTDTIVNAPYYYGSNTVVFGSGISSSDIRVTQGANGEDLTLTDTVTGQSLILQGQIGPAANGAPSQINEVDFGDGTSWSASDLLSMSVQSAISAGNSVIYGDRNDNVIEAGSGNITLVGQGDNDTLIAGLGNDTLIGGGGYTTYQIGASASSYVIDQQNITPGGGPGGGPDGGPMMAMNTRAPASLNSSIQYGSDGELDLIGIDPSSVVLSESADGNDVIISVSGSSETITLKNEVNGFNNGAPVVDAVTFGDGTVWSSSDLENMLAASGGGSSPEIDPSGTTATASIAELANTTDSNTPDTASGAIAFTDRDISAVHAASVVGVSMAGEANGALSNTALLGYLTLGAATEPADGQPGSVAWAFAAPDSAFDYLAVGESVTLTYAVELTGSQGGPVTQNIDVTITGANDAPVVLSSSSTTGAIVEQSTTTGSNVADTASGEIQFADADLSDTHTLAVSSVTLSGATAGLPASTTLLSYLTTGAVTEQSGPTPGSIPWTFSAPDSTFDYLQAGQTATLTYVVTLGDGHTTVQQNVSVTVTGTNDAPMFATGSAPASVNENWGGTGSTVVDTTTGLVRFTDADAGDTHVATVTGVVASQRSAGLPGNATLLGWLSMGPTSEQDGTTPGSSTWTFSAPDNAFDYLDAGEWALLTYTVRITDAAGGTLDQNVLVRIYGAPDAPVIDASTSAAGAIAELAATTGSTAADTAAGAIRFTDADTDASDTHSLTINSVTSSGAIAGLPASATLLSYLTTGAVTEQSGLTPGSIPWTFSAPDNTFDYLQAGQTATLTYVVTLADRQHTTVQQNIVVTVTGANDAPVAAQHDGFTTDNWTPLTISAETLLGGATDPDLGDVPTLASVQDAVGGTAALSGGDAVFTPSATSIGAASFTYTISDGHGGTSTARTSLTTTLHQITGTSGNDTLVGGVAMAQIDGLDGDDAITAGTAGDKITGGAGNDVLTGGAGSDTFIYHSGFGNDTINSFAATGAQHDVLQFDSTVFSDWAHLLGATTQQGSDLVIQLDSTDTIRLSGIALASFTQNDLKFVSP